MRSTRHALPTALAAALLLTSCSGSGEPAADIAPPSYVESSSITAQVLPQIASSGEDTEDADDAAWVVEARLEHVDKGTAVRLVALEDDEWETVDEAETDKKGRVTLTSTVGGDLHVLTEGDGGDEGTELSTTDVPEVSFADDFDEDSVDESDGGWATRSQGYAGVRQCSKAVPEAAEVADGVLRLSVLDDPDRGKCPYKGKQFDYRLNGHVGTEQIYSFTYGFAAARVKFQEERGQHGSFWMQAAGGPRPLGPEKGGAEIDVVEYFGDDHPQGGLTSFTYWDDQAGKPHKQGGWIPDVEDFDEDWSDEFHTFSVEWTPKEYVFRIDGEITHTLKGKTSGQPEFLVLSLLSSDYELKHSENLPSEMVVDWVRVWETGS